MIFHSPLIHENAFGTCSKWSKSESIVRILITFASIGGWLENLYSLQALMKLRELNEPRFNKDASSSRLVSLTDIEILSLGPTTS